MIDANIRALALQAARRICGEWVVEYAGLAPEISRGMSQDAVFVARTLRAMIHGDHDDLITREWLLEVGGKPYPCGFGDDAIRFGDDLIIYPSFVPSGVSWNLVVETAFRRWFRMAPCHTRGDFRHRAEAVGFKLIEKFEPFL